MVFIQMKINLKVGELGGPRCLLKGAIEFSNVGHPVPTATFLHAIKGERE